MKWTNDQYKAISSPKPGTLPSQTLLVAAAAGSGKTAVLVERIIQRLQDKEHPLAINELLVLTFTKAASAEMKGRIGAKLAEVYNETNDPYLEEQLNLLPSAQISTLHSFCQWVIRNYFYELDMDPMMTIGNEGQIGLIRADAMDKLFERAYEDDLYHIYTLSTMFSANNSDAPLKHLVEEIYLYSRAQENPTMWIEGLRIDKEGFVGTLDETVWGAYFLHEYAISVAQFERYYKNIERAMEVADNHKYIGKMADILALWYKNLVEDATWDSVHNIAIKSCQINWPRVSWKSWKDKNIYDDVLIDEVRSSVEYCKNFLKNLYTTSPFKLSSDDWRKQLGAQHIILDGLVGLVLAFDEEFKGAKQKEGLLDFNDLEHNCLALLTDHVDTQGYRVPSKVALELQQHFKEIMIDEYQDTNGVQEAIVNLVSNIDNRFYVGDVKQSIYGFRMADPTLFLEKYNRFGYDLDDVERRIDLSQNFRSHHHVLNGTNYIFSQIMTKEATDLDYGVKEALYAGRNLADAPDDYVGGPIELIIIDKNNEQNAYYSDEEERNEDSRYENSSDDANRDTDSGEELENIELESHEIARKLKEMYDGQRKVQNKDGTYRTMRWSDVAILLRSVSNKGNRMADVLREYGIPAYVTEKSGYFQSMEVQLLLSMLQIIDNPEQDLPMAAVLRSPLVGIDSNTLGNIRVFGYEKDSHSTLWQVLREYAIHYDHKRLLIFVDQLEGWRTLSRRHSVSEVIWQVFEDTQFVAYVSAMPNGLARRANVLALYERAKDYEAGSFRGIFRFLRFIENWQNMGGDLAVASTLGEGDDVVRIMTIHQSKGLEFPIVFLADANKKFNEQDLSNMLLLHKDGVGLRGYFEEWRVSYPSLPWLYVQNKLRRAGRAEEQRVLYVALTRAKDKLFIVGVVPNESTFLKEDIKQVVAEPKAQLGRDIIVSQNTYLKWIYLALARHLDCSCIRNIHDVSLSEHDPIPFSESRWQITITPSQEINSTQVAKKKEKFDDIASQITDTIKPHLVERLTYTYPFAVATKTTAKTTITELKRRFAMPSDEAQNYDDLLESTREEIKVKEEEKESTLLSVFDVKPSWLIEEEERIIGAQYGTLMHTVMQWLPIQSYTIKTLRSALKELVKKGIISEEEEKKVYAPAIVSFFESSLGKRLMQAKEVHKEFSFSLLLEGNNYYADLEKGEQLFLQGIMDLVFLEDDGWVLVDYKTDRIESGDELWKRYAIQLDVYSHALEQITGKKVKDIYIYSFALQEALAQPNPAG